MKSGVCVLLLIFAWGPGVSAQTPADPAAQAAQSTSSPDQPAQQAPGEPPLGPAELQDQQIRQYDPLAGPDKSSAGSGNGGNAKAGNSASSAPIPGSVAASNQANAQGSGPEVEEDGGADQPVQEYTGPAVLSRSYSIDRPLIPEEVKWQESAGVGDVYDSGIERPVNANGTPGNSTLLGTMLNWSFSGRHYFRRDQIAVSYTGNFQQYSGPGAYNGGNNSATVNYTHYLSRHISLSLVGTGSILAQNTTLVNQSAGPETIANINIGTSPNIQILDAGMKSFSSGADVVWQKTSRLSFDGGATYFGVSQDNPQLLGVTGQQFRGDTNYRLTRQTTVGAYYSYGYYLYPRGIGYSHINTGGLIYSYALNRTTQLRLRGGVSHVSSLELQTVPIAPALAALLGVGSGQIDSTQATNGMDMSAQLVKDLSSRQTISISYAHGISPGNGVYMTSQQQSIAGSFTARVFRSYALNVGLGRDTFSSIGQYLGKYEDEYATISLNRSYKRGVGLSLALQYRYFDITEFSSIRNELRITSGVSWGSGSGRLWPF